MALTLTLEGREAAARGECKLRVFVYWNLHKHCWSIKALAGYAKGKVIAHASEVTLFYPYGKVSEAGRQRVIREQKKNVHAGLIGMFDFDCPNSPVTYPNDVYEQITTARITYNPYKAPTFTKVGTDRPFIDAERACMWTTEDGKARVTVRDGNFAE